MIRLLQLMLKDAPYAKEIVDPPVNCDSLCLRTSICLNWRCGNSCTHCHKHHEYKASGDARFLLKDCIICSNPNKCPCVIQNEGYICTGCKVFFANKENKCKARNFCKNCRSCENNNDLDKFLKKCMKSCQNNCKGRIGDRAKFELDLEFLKQLYVEQKGNCHYSNMKMCLETLSDFQLSVERLDEENGYTKTNIRLIILELQNGHRQWTKIKFTDFCQDYNDFEIVSDKESELIKTKCDEALVEPLRKQQRNKLKIVNINGMCNCNYCNERKSCDLYSKRGLERGKCKDCEKNYYLTAKNNITLRQKLSNLLNSSRNNTKNRNKTKHRTKKPLVDTLTFEELVDMYLNQSGRCLYSNKQLQLVGDNQISLERINTKIGYSKENCSLIILELNSCDQSSRKIEEDTRTGSSGWSKEKVKLVVDNYKKTSIT